MSRARTMQAAYIDQVGGPIRIGALPVPRPGPTDVRVQVAASGVNHVDLFVRSGAYRTHTPLPFVIGRDAVGTVVEVGAGVGGQPYVFDRPALPVRQIGRLQSGKEAAYLGNGVAMRSVVDLRTIAGRVREPAVLQMDGEVDEGSRHG